MNHSAAVLVLVALVACSGGSVGQTADTPGPALNLALPSLPLKDPKLAPRWSDGDPTAWCLLDTDGWVSCSGLAGGEDIPPEGQFVDVAGGDVYHCALDQQGRARCWGSDERKVPGPVPDQIFVSLVADQVQACGLRTDGSVLCWGRTVAAQPFTARLAALLSPLVGLDSEGRVVLADRIDDGKPDGVFVRVAVRGLEGAGIRPDGSLLLWASTLRAPAEHSGPWQDIVLSRYAPELGIGQPCAIDESGQVKCLGAGGWRVLDVPGKAITVARADADFCVLGEGMEVFCYGPGPTRYRETAPGMAVSSRPGDPARTAVVRSEEQVKPTESHRVSCLRYLGCVCALGLTESCAEVQELLDRGDPPSSCDGSLRDIQTGLAEVGTDVPLACQQEP